jgi:large subunit ribosomal protein L10
LPWSKELLKKYMAVSKQKKSEIFEKVKGAVKSASSVFVNFHGLTVADVTEMRKALTSQNISYFVSKKTVAKKALGESGIEGELPSLEGELAIVSGEDLISPAREVYNFQKKFKEKLSIVGGIFEGKYKSKDEMVSIASIPSQKTLYAQFVNIINSPIQGLVIALDAIAKSKEGQTN